MTAQSGKFFHSTNARDGTFKGFMAARLIWFSESGVLVVP